MRILITGATGFIGSHLAIRLLGSGHMVTLVSSHPRKLKIPGCSLTCVDLTQETSFSVLKETLNQCDRAYFLAASLPPRPNVAQTNNRIDSICSKAFFASTCPEAIYLSGLTVFPQNEDLIVDEQSHPSENLSPYFASKLAGERLFASESPDKQVKILRVNAPYGPGMSGNHVISRFLNLALRDKELTVYGNGERSQHFTWVGDIARILAHANEIPTGISHFCGPERVNMLQLARLCLKVCKSFAGVVCAGVEKGQSCPYISHDRLETVWPRAERTPLAQGLYLFAQALKKNIQPQEALFQ